MSLHPEIQRLLTAFQRRRRFLWMLRGVLAGGAVFVFGTVLAVLIDAPLVLEEEPRVVLAGMVYGSVLSVFGWLGLRPWRAGSAAQVAGVLETVAPQLKGTLLAAVELLPTAAHSDSTAFREALQEQTVQRIQGVSIPALLPLKLLKKDAVLLTFAVFLIGCGFAFNGARFGWQCARALLPLANFERLSDIAITVVQPSPMEGIVPADEPLQIEVSLVSPREVEPVVWAKQAHGPRLRIPMRTAGPGRFEATLPVEQTPLVYQVRAGDSVTRRFQLEPKARPRIASYSRTYHYPEYTGLSDRTVTSSEGTLSALEGTVVELALLPDQAVAAGSLALALGQGQRALPLNLGSGPQEPLRARFELTEGGAYTVRLVSAETGLKSAAGPQNGIQVELDAPPNVVLEVPAQDLVLPLGEPLLLEGTAEDDFGLATVELEVRRNQSAWQRNTLAVASGKKFQIRTSLDALAYKARPGEVLSVRFSATDARGQRGESRAIRLSLAPPGTVPRPDAALAAERRVARQLKELATESAEAAAALEKLKAQSERGTQDDLKASEAKVRAEQALERALQSAEAARSALGEASAEADLPTAEAALRLEARVLGVAQWGELKAAKQALEQLFPLAGHKGAAVEAARFAQEAAAAGASLARVLEEAARTRLDLLEAAALAPVARALSQEMAVSVKEVLQGAPAEGQHATGEAEALRRQQVNQAASSQLLGQLQKLVERAQPLAGALRPGLEELRKTQALAENAVAAATPAEADSAPKQDAASAGEALAGSLDRAATALDGTRPALQAAAERAQTALKRADRSNSEIVERIAREIAARAHKQNVPDALRETAVQIRTAAAADTLRANAENAALSGAPSPQLARALVQAASVLEAPVEGNGEGAKSAGAVGTQVAEVARLLKAVESGAALESAHRQAEEFAAQLNHQNGPPSPAQMAARKQLREEVQALPKQVREARLPESAAIAAREAGEALGESSSAGLSRAAQALQVGADAAAESVEKALVELAKKAPSLTRQMEHLADKALNASEATEALVQKIASQTSNAVEPQALAGAMRKEADFERKLDQLQQALRAEANAQDVRSAKGRENARDADGAAAQLKDAGHRAQAALQQAAARVSERQALLEKAAAFQKQGAQQLRGLAENFQKLQSPDPAERAAARQALRAEDKALGADASLDARQERLAELAQLAELAKMAPAKALVEAEALASRNPQSSRENPPVGEQAGRENSGGPDSAGSGEATAQGGPQKAPVAGERAAAAPLALAAKAGLAEARAALKEGGEEGAARAAQSLSKAVDAQADADRGERAQDGAAASGGAHSANALSGMADPGSKGLPAERHGGGGDWGNLPKRLATDIVEGKRESAPSEYREAVEAYFRAVGERARAGAARQ